MLELINVSVSDAAKRVLDERYLGYDSDSTDFPVGSSVVAFAGPQVSHGPGGVFYRLYNTTHQGKFAAEGYTTYLAHFNEWLDGTWMFTGLAGASYNTANGHFIRVL